MLLMPTLVSVFFLRSVIIVFRVTSVTGRRIRCMVMIGSSGGVHVDVIEDVYRKEGEIADVVFAANQIFILLRRTYGVGVESCAR